MLGSKPPRLQESVSGEIQLADTVISHSGSLQRGSGQ